MSLYQTATIGTDTNQIALTQGKYAIVDASDFEHLNQWKWCYVSSGYAMRRETVRLSDGTSRNRYVLMHRQLMSPTDTEQIDHINRNRLDNRKSNLRIANQSENMANASLRKDNTSGFRGVYWFKPYKKWKVSISMGGKEHHIGYFCNKEDAINARKEAALRIHKEFANVTI